MEMKLKDWVTLGNLACGLGAIGCLIVDPFTLGPLGNFDVACFLVVFGFVFDALDGLVARLTKQFNKFGSELDNLCDMISYSMAPGFLLFHAFHYQANYSVWLAAFIAFVPVAAGTIRAARFNVRRAEFPGFFIGFPRTGFALVTVALLQSTLFRVAAEQYEWLFLVPVGLVVLTSFMMLSLHGFASHHGFRWKGWIRFGMWFFLISIPVGLVAGWLLDYPALLFDLLLFDQMVYMFVSHLAIKPEVRAEYKAYIKQWKAMS